MQTDIKIVTPEESGRLVECSNASPAQKRFMISVIREGSTFYHDFGNGEVCILDVSHFFNHGVDIPLMQGVAAELSLGASRWDSNVALTAASGGNIVTYSFCQAAGIERMVYAPKKPSIIHQRNGAHVAGAHSYTGGSGADMAVAKTLLKPGDRVVWVDDFLDTGKMTKGAVDLIEQSGAELVGCVYAVDKIYAGGREKVDKILTTMGLPHDRQLAFISIVAMEEGIVQFEGFEEAFTLLRESNN